ncbi:hypothetical protein V2O64_17575 [Verrucomicrobiaceae bacterium 227]
MKASPLLAAITATSLGIILCQAEQRYIDADYDGNTSNAETGSTTDWTVDPAANENGAPGADNLWGQRTTGPAGPAFNTTVWQLTFSEEGPTLVTVATGLLPNTTYGGLRVYFSGKESTANANEWYIDASVNGVDFITYLDGSANATAVDVSNNGVGAEIIPSTTADIRYYASLPDGTTDENGDLRIWIREGVDTSNRTVYDGIGFDDTPLAGSAGLAITDFSHDDATGTSSITWNSVDAANYVIEVSTDLESWSEAIDEAVGTGTSTTLSIVIEDLRLPADPGTNRVFFRVLSRASE